jgi:hypothetical protein
VKTLLIGVGGDERLEVADKLCVAAELQLGVETLDLGRQPELTSFSAVAGGRSPHSSSTRRNVETTSFACRSSTPSNASGFEPPSGTTRSPSRTSSGPRIRNCIRAFREDSTTVPPPQRVLHQRLAVFAQ